METGKNIFKGKYIIFAGIFLAVILVILYAERGLISENLISGEVEFSDPVSYYSRNDNTYLVNNGGMEIIVLQEGKYHYSIEGGEAEEGFYSAREVVCDDEGNIYVLDKLLNDNGKNVDAERIVKFNADGKFEEIVYEYEHGDGSSVLQLFDLSFIDGKLCFIHTNKNNSFNVITLLPSGKQELRTLNYTGVYENAWDFAVSGTDVYISSKKGCIDKIDESGNIKTEYAGEDNNQYYSIPTKLQAVSDGTLYYNDIGLRTINKISPDGVNSVVVEAAEPLDEKPESFNTIPIYTDFFVEDNGNICVIYSDTIEAEGEGAANEEIEYRLYEKTLSGEAVFNGNSVKKITALTLKSAGIAVLLVLMCLLIIYLAVFFIIKLRGANISIITKIQAAVVLTAVCVACISAYILVNNSNTIYYEEVMNKIANITEMTARNIDEEDVENITGPQDFRNDSYNRISKTVHETLDSDLNKENGMYCVLYKVQSDIVTAIYADDDMYGTGYPMPGAYEGSTEKEIYESGEGCSVYSHNSADGTYMFELAPVFGGDGEVVALIEIGIDLYTFAENTRRQVVNIMISLIAIIMVAVLLFTELMSIAGALKKRRPKLQGIQDAELIRPIAFLLFFASNMPTAFLPNFSKALYQQSFPMSVEVAAALPVSAELLFASLTALCLGFAVAKLGSRLLCAAGAVMLGLGSLMCAFAPDLTVLIIASCITGIGDGLIMVAVNSYIAGYEDEDQKKRGFISYNAALLAGVNCGTVLGSVIADKFGYTYTYIAAAVVSLLIVPFAVLCIKNHDKKTVNKEERTGMGAMLGFIFKPNVIKYFVLILMPYLICAAFLNYFFPLFGEENALTPTQISLAFLLMGIISVYAGPALSKLTADKLGSKKSMILASALYAAGLVIFIVRPMVSSCYIAIALFAFADSFGFTSQSVYYSSLPEARYIGDGPAMGISSAVENIASTVGPLIFGAALMLGTVQSISLIAGVFIALTAGFMLTSFSVSLKNGRTKGVSK